MLIVGIWLGFAGQITAGEVIAFAFLVSLFVMPVQMGTQILTEAQNAIAGWRRVIGILETPADLVDPGPDGQVLPRGPIDVEFRDVTFAYPDGPDVLHEIDMHIGSGTRVAIVGETGSGKSTFAKLLTRLMDPREGGVLLDGIDVRLVQQSSLRRSVVLVPAGGLPVRRHAAGPTPSTAGSGPATRTSSPPPPSSAWPTGSTACRAGWTPGSVSAASRCRPASGSWSRCSARTWPTPTCWSSTRPPAPSTPTSRCGSAGPWSGSCRAAPRSPSPTG